ncbi:15834_t:CDS:2, partial [Gigaspora rosea]
MDAVGKLVALLDENMKITNTLRYRANHLKDSISHINEDEEEDSISTTSTHSSGSFLKKQTTLSQYIGRPLNVSEVPKLERLVLCAIISSGVAFRWIENPE